MTKTLTALAAVATMAVAAVAVPQQAQARWGHWGPGPFVGGLAAGAIIGGALASPYYYGGYGYYGGPYYNDYYGGPYAYYGGYGDCWRERVWTPYGWRWHRVCR